ncbi:MAG: site-specific integrase [Acetatifactor sp.]|nr:site-specific integrase [Acetatifactor sp.]
MNYNEIVRQDILQCAFGEGILDLGSVLNMVMERKKAKIKKLHSYAITPPANDKGRWQTWVMDEKSGKLKNVKAQTEEQLLDKLVKYYFPEMNLEKLTFHDLYEEWLEFKKTITNSPNTIKRHMQHYKRYLEGSALETMKVARTDEILLEKECNRLVKEYNLSRKEYCNIKTIINGMYAYAVRRKYLSENPMDKVKIYVKYKQMVKKTGKTETYNTEELRELNRYLEEKYAETGDSVFLAVKLNFLLGLRVGELVALKWEDYSDINHLHIVREEIRDQLTNEVMVADHTKTNCDRYVALVPKAIALLQRIPRDDEYIFVRNGERIRARQIVYVLEKYAERKGIAPKRSHKIRKTYASNLDAKGVPLDCIREQLGHSNLSTTLGYIYNPLTEKETYELMSKAL